MRAHRGEHAAALHRDQHFVELQRVDVEEPPVDLEAEAAERRRLGHQQRVAAESPQRRSLASKFSRRPSSFSR
jgi:hypothetical protein